MSQKHAFNARGVVQRDGRILLDGRDITEEYGRWLNEVKEDIRRSVQRADKASDTALRNPAVRGVPMRRARPSPVAGGGLTG